MSRTLDARLSKIEQRFGGEFAGPSYGDLLRTIRGMLRGLVDSADTGPAEREAARDKLASLDAKVWARYGETEKVNIIDALAAAKAAECAFSRTVDPRDGDVSTPDWCAVACELGLLLPGDAGPRSGPARLIERLIVSPPPYVNQLSEAHGTLQ